MNKSMPKVEKSNIVLNIPNTIISSAFKDALKLEKILEKMDIPDNWIIVVNSSKNHYNRAGQFAI